MLRNFLVFCLLAAILVPVYAGTLNSPFIFDDFHNITENRNITISTISRENLTNAATENPIQYRLLPYLTFTLNYYFGGQDVLGYHVVNLLIHILVAFTFYLLALTTLSLPRFADRYRHPREIALAAALLWALHPLQTNAVTYIVQRMTSMAALFYLASLLFYVRSRLVQKSRGKRIIWLAASLVAGLMALASKENSAMLPLMVVAYDLFFIDRPGQKINVRKKVFWLAATLSLVILIGWIYVGGDLLSNIIAGYNSRDFTLSERLFTESRILFFYLSLLVLPLPSRLNFLHDFPISHSFYSPPQTLAAIFGLICLIFLIFFLFQRYRLVAFAIFWFLGNLVIESSIIPLMLIFEHRVYLPSMFLFLAGVALLYRFVPVHIKWKRTVLVLFAGILCLFTWQRNMVWKDNITFWSDVVAKSPGLSGGYINLSNAIEDEGKHKEAEQLLRKAIELDPENGAAYLNLGCVLEKRNRLQEALANLEIARSKKKVDLAKLHTNLGLVYRRMKNFAQAKEESVTALHYDPYSTNALLTLGIVYSETGRLNKALEQFQKAEDMGLDTVDLYNNWGITYYKLSRTDEAISLFKQALAINPNHPESHYNLGIAYSSKGMMEEARKEMSLAMRLRQ